MTRLILLLIISVISCIKASGQFYDLGQEPWNTKWEQIHTENFRLIYPDFYKSEAKEAARLFEQWHLPLTRSLKVIPKKMPVIFHTGNIYSNAYTIWAPRRIELLTVPPQDIYSQQWIEQLVLHEYRHAVQISKLDQGFTHFLGFIFGEQAAPAIIGLFVPSWFMEGDAVATETALTSSGRGRVADFARPLKAQLREKGLYSYSKASLGSYKDFVPDPYILGYHIVAKARDTYGIDVWNSAIDRTARKPYTLNPFSQGIKLVTGLSKSQLYEKSMKDLDSLWRDNKKTTDYFKIRTSADNTYTNYLHPIPFLDGTIALKSSLKDIHRFVFIDRSGNETILHTPGFLLEDEISFNGKVITWIEQRPDRRWETRGFSNIMIFNPATREIRKLKTTLRVFAPAMSPDNHQIVLSEISLEGRNFLTFIDSAGKVVNRIASPLNMFISSPSWSPDGKEIAYIATGATGKQIVIFNAESGTHKIITPVVYDMLSDVQHLGNKILFNMDVNGQSEICSMDTLSREVRQLTVSKYGTKHPYIVPETGLMLYSNYTADGYRIAQGLNRQFTYTHIEFNHNNRWLLADELGEQEASLVETQTPDDSLFIEKYPKSSGLFNFHSWAPVFIDIEDQKIRPGVSVMSQNLLSTMFLTAGYDYNLEENTGQVKADLSWRGWYPEISTSFSSGNRSAVEGSGDTAYRFTWNETSFDLAAGLPLNTLSGTYSTGSYLEIKHQFLNSSHNPSTPHDFRSGNIGALNYRASFYILRKRAHRDLASRWGITAEAHYKHSPYGDFKSGDLFSILSRLYLPGFIRNHSFQVFGGYQLRKTSAEGYRFAGDLNYPSGYSGTVPKYLVRIRPSYSLPLVHPDYNIGTLLYVKRLRTNLFYDAAWIKEHNEWGSISSAGYDLIIDFHAFSLPAPISLGVRSSYLFENNEMNFSLIFSLDVTSY
ncbi:MAG TPA: hypothetical protein VK212_08815 [Lentimicrobium sp.]|nr:hypothetical protein [Lentimicrobium sp.]